MKERCEKVKKKRQVKPKRGEMGESVLYIFILILQSGKI